MKKVLLSALVSLTVASGAMAQYMDGLVKVSGATQDGEGIVNVTIFPANTCNDNTTLDGWSNANFHSGYASDNGTGLSWTGPTTAFDANGQLQAFTRNSDGTFTFSFVPRTHYNLDASLYPVGSLQGFAFVVNGATAVGDPAAWTHNARALDAPGGTTCKDFVIPFPVPANLILTSVNSKVNRVSNLTRQNKPNPFTGETTIEYTLASRDNVSLKVFNLLGEQVAVLASGETPAGTHSVKWNATVNGSRVPAGIYFYTFSTSTATDTKSMIVAQ